MMSSLRLCCGLLLCIFVAGAGNDGTFSVQDYGAKGDGSTDDTAAVQRAIDAASSASLVVSLPGLHDAVVVRSTVVFARGIYRLNATLQLGRHPPDLLGHGRPVLQMTDNSSDIFFGSNVWRWKASGLAFFGGANQLHIGNNNTDRGQILVDDCSFLGASAAAVRLLEPSGGNWPLTVGQQRGRGRRGRAGGRGGGSEVQPWHTLVKFGGSFSTQVDIRRCVFDGCAQALVNWADWTTVSSSWVTSSPLMANDSAVFENHDRLFLTDILGVPHETGGTPLSRQRWVDNYAYRSGGGRVAMRQFRFGGEGSGLGGVFNFAPFACQLVRSNYSHLDLCARVPHDATVLPPNVSIVPGTAVTIHGSKIDTHQNIIFLEEVPAHVEVAGNEVNDGSGQTGILVMNVTESINLGGPVFSELLARAAEGRRWLSYSIGASNWNGPTVPGGALPKELQPFQF